MTAICNACGQEWPRHPALEVECPVCGADAGLGCRRPSGHAGPFIEPHQEREQLAVDRRILEMCPEGPTAKRERNATGASQPALVYEVIQKQDANEAEPVYEGRIIEPETGEMVHNEPYRSPLMEPVAAWFSRETETDPPPELTPANHDRRRHWRHCNESQQRRRG